ncbi:ABC transporter ATP-binding protein [Candidatus Bathyarchaeota archaeon]|nr:MAG: ABC transporter ATP-binding protein [Candidatus Bathyarchaeota archaeon]
MAEAIEVKDLTKRYTSSLKKGWFRREKIIVKALKKISFNVKYGEVFGLLGPNGAGKTTTVKILATLLLPDGGSAKVAGYDVVEFSSIVRNNIGVTLTVEKGFFWKLTGRENLKYFGMLMGIRGDKLNRRVNELLNILGLERLGVSDKFYEEYSLGMKARLSLARALLKDPPILILDEPTLGLDPPSARAMRELLIKLAKEDGKAILLTTHNMFEAEMICDRVAIIDEGRIISLGKVDELKRMVARRVIIDIVASGTPIGIDAIKDRISEMIDGNVGLSMDDKGRLRIRILSRAGSEESNLAEAIKILSNLSIRVNRVRLEEPTLEDVFIALTGKSGI